MMAYVAPGRSSRAVDVVLSLAYALDHIDEPLCDWKKLAKRSPLGVYAFWHYLFLDILDGSHYGRPAIQGQVPLGAG